MRTAIIIFLLFAMSAKAQDLKDFELVDNFKHSGLTTNVYFKDPLKQLIKTYPDFDLKDNKEKHSLLTAYLLENTLYIFQTLKKKELQKSYILAGNPKKLRTRNYFSLTILNADRKVDKVIDQLSIGGSFFEHMLLFQSSEGKAAVGKGVQIWGYFVLVEPYANLKDKIVDLIEKDLNNAIPDEILLKEKQKIEPLFPYQTCALENVKSRRLTTTVLSYDSLGNIRNKYSRTENDTQLYLSSTSKEIIWTTSLPYFSVTDEKIVEGNTIKINSKLENINYYLKDLRATTNATTGEIEKIEGQVILHGTDLNGPTTDYELYKVEFAKIGKCNLPVKVIFCPLNDLNYQKPRIITEIVYTLNQ